VNAPAAQPLPPLGELIARLSGLHPERIDLDLKRMHRLLERLGHPERAEKLPARDPRQDLGFHGGRAVPNHG